MSLAAVSPVLASQLDTHVAAAARRGLTCRPKRLPSWLFYDHAGSRLFEAITAVDEYYLTRTERSILASQATGILAAAIPAADPARLRIAELGAGSADKTRLLLKAAVERQGTVIYEPIDVSSSALHAARQRIEREIAGVHVAPVLMDYTHSNGHGLALQPVPDGERLLVLYIGSSIGNFEPTEAAALLERLRAALKPGDCLLLGIDLVKDESILLAAYDDAAGVTAAFNRNLLTRLNRELAADFNLDAFDHRALWNPIASRIEMHLESRAPQRVRLGALDLEVEFAPGETIHTENSYKYRPGQAEAMLANAGFATVARWSDPRNWFAVCLGRAQ